MLLTESPIRLEALFENTVIAAHNARAIFFEAVEALGGVAAGSEQQIFDYPLARLPCYVPSE